MTNTDKKLLDLAHSFYNAKILMLASSVLNIVFTTYALIQLARNGQVIFSIAAFINVLFNFLIVYAAYSVWRGSVLKWTRKPKEEPQKND